MTPKAVSPVRVGGSLTTTVRVQGPDGSIVETSGFIDCGSQINLIHPDFASQHNLGEARPVPITADAIQGIGLNLTGEYLLKTTITDSDGVTKETLLYFYGCRMPKHNIVIGTPWLEQHALGYYG